MNMKKERNTKVNKKEAQEDGSGDLVLSTVRLLLVDWQAP